MIDRKTAKSAMRAMELELARSMKGLRVDGHPAPCYLSYLLRTREGFRIWGRYGTVFDSDPIRSTTLHVDLRVGSYRSDQTLDGRLDSDKDDPHWHDWCDGPQNLDPFAIRYTLWRLTQARHREAIQDYYDKKKASLDERLVEDAPSLRKGRPDRIEASIGRLRGTQVEAEAFVARASTHFKKYPRIEDPYVQFKEVVQTRVQVNSEGARSIAQERFFEVYVFGEMLAPDGIAQVSSKTFYVRNANELPDDATMEHAVDAIYRDLCELTEAPSMEPHAGPALFDGTASGVLFHEAIGHRLEGERLLSRTEGHTFSGKVGKRILPEGIDIFDDPSLAKFEGHSLYGHYTVDDEGTPAQRVHLVQDGVLRLFLTSRNGIPGQGSSNGHGRVTYRREVMARMANLIVAPRNPVSRADLEQVWMQEVDDQDQPFGVLVASAESGETATSSDAYDFQAFQITPTAVYTVDATSGKKSRVRDVSFVGTPLAAIQGVIALGDDPAVDNSYCGAESGSIPVGTVAPSALLREIELQRSTGTRHQPSTLKLPPRG